MTVVKKAGLLSADEAYKLIAPVIIEMFDEIDLDPRTEENVSDKLGFTPFEAVTKWGQIQTKLGITGTPLVGEFDSFVLDDTKYGNKIGYDVERVFPAEGMSSEAKKWIEKASGLKDVPLELKKDLANSISQIARKVKSIKITENEYKTLVLTEGFDISREYGFGSAVYDGKSLFADDHFVIDTGEVYSNIVDQGLAETGTADNKHAPLTFNALKYAINMHRGMKDGLGTRVKRPMSGIYDLIISPELEETALNILSDGNGFSPYTYAGADAGNDNYGNVFMRDGFKVRLVILETMNQPATLKEGTVGSDTVWFLMNKEGATAREALRDVNFGDVEIEIFYDKSKKATFLTAEKFFGAQPLYPEVIVGSKWDASTI